MKDYVIEEWQCSLYCWENNLWKYGKLTMCCSCFCFFEDNSSNEASISVEFRRVSGFQRRLVSLIYKGIVVSIEGEKPLWFSSFKSREEVFYFLEHFWKERLVLTSRRTSLHSGQSFDAKTFGSRSNRKQKLLKVLYDSESTLTEAANSLYNQGEQLHDSVRTMNQMHKDLNVTERLLKGLDSWFTKWDIEPENFYEIPMKKEYSVLFRKHRRESFWPGTLVMFEDQVTVLNLKRVADVTLLLKELTTIDVHTPWTISLIKSILGEHDIVVEISSAQVVYILKALQLKCGHKFQYEDISLGSKKEIDVAMLAENISEVSGEIYSEFGRLSFLSPKDTNSHVTGGNQPGGAQVGDLRLSDVDESDIDTVSDVISRMKSMAVGINQEMSRQLDSVDHLSESVDKANCRIRRDGRKIQEKL